MVVRVVVEESVLVVDGGSCGSREIGRPRLKTNFSNMMKLVRASA
jgi:hypothetical protein